MIRLSILYPNKENSRFDTDYYIDTHMPMAIEKLGPALRGLSVEQGLPVADLPGRQPTYIVMCHMLFDSVEAFMEAFAPQQALLQGDMPNYTDVEPVFQFSEVRIFI